MKKFKFRLEKVLEHKVRLFDIAQEKYMIEHRILQTEEAALERIKDEYRHSMFAVTKRTQQAFTIKELAVHYKYLFHLKREMKNQVDVVFAQQKIVNEKRSILVEASKEKELLIRLKDKRHRSYLAQCDHDEQKAMDDIANAKYIQQL